jgi:hypothetical protein
MKRQVFVNESWCAFIWIRSEVFAMIVCGKDLKEI